MALIPASSSEVITERGEGEVFVTWLLRQVDTGDTFDVGDILDEVKAGSFFASGDLTVVGTVSAVGSVVTLTLAGMSNDSVWLSCIGQRSI